MDAKVGIFGSCVTRDAFAFANLPVAVYYARTTIASMAAAPCHETYLDTVQKPFVRRMLRNDFEKHFPREIGSLPIECLIIDCIDERFDNVPYKNTIITRSSYIKDIPSLSDSINSLTGLPLRKRIADNNSINAFCSNLNNANITIFLHEALLAEEHYDFDYRHRKPFAQIDNIRAINSLLAQLYEKLKARLNCVPLRVCSSLRVADPGHKWGLAPCHYSKAYYMELIGLYKRIAQKIAGGKIKKIYHWGGNHVHIRCINKKLSGMRYENLHHSATIAYKCDPDKLLEPDASPKLLFELDWMDRESVAHFFNYINVGSMPYVASFETILPYYFGANQMNMEALLYHLQKPECLALLPLSQCAYDMTEKLLKIHASAAMRAAIMAKMRVLHPPQPVIAAEPRQPGDKINFVFIGRQFFRKGGYEMLLALELLKTKYNKFNLFIISNMELNENWNVTMAKESEIAHATEIMNGKDYITWHKHLPNDQVMQLLKTCHVGLLPTYQETYGFCVLEMQACAIPVITTDIRALPEINNNEIGWIINMPGRRELRHGTDPDRVKEHKRANFLQLYAILENILENPEQIAAKGRLAVERIARMHDPDAYSRDLRYFYSRAFHAI